MAENRKILLHVCCAPCGSACVERLLAEGREVILYFSNSNIDCKAEFDRRLSHVERLAGIFEVGLEIDPYRHDLWLEAVRGLESEPEKGRRCLKCFTWNLERAARRAAADGIAGFTTALTVSPQKNSRLIFETGRCRPGFEARDFKKRDGFRRSVELSAEFGFYRQNYCGCEFSLRQDSGRKQSPAADSSDFSNSPGSIPVKPMPRR
ncbi:MAG: epoxyqueuosine reductase QueH [Victivallaceae bacterium]|nr:epoxyqueuosine reductase QueH [Victivallaceae bacterium]